MYNLYIIILVFYFDVILSSINGTPISEGMTGAVITETIKPVANISTTERKL